MTGSGPGRTYPFENSNNLYKILKLNNKFIEIL